MTYTNVLVEMQPTSTLKGTECRFEFVAVFTHYGWIKKMPLGSGASFSGKGVTQPPFVLLNFDDTYRISEILKCNESSTFTWCALQFLPHPDSSFWKGTKLCYDKECHLLMRKIGEEHIVILRTIGVERHLGSNSIVIFCGTQRKCMLNTGNKTTKTLRILLPLVLRIYFRKTGWLCRASNESKVMLL